AQRGGAARMAPQDVKFMKDAAQGGMAEVQLGKMAAQKGASSDVKQFGQRMADDHSKANQELMDLAKQKGVALPSDTGAAHKALMSRLSRLSGAAFDRTYMGEMVKDHTKDVREFQHAAQTAKDADLKAWAGKTLPTLQDHLKMAKEIDAGLGKSAAKK
ncbi:MAG TPA: DUF4142 domain-containing protein, partial [Armatimonadota bacterium]|nr:DUF4142 domain-containing protein [Armatimonadota bacterium]